MPNKKFLEEYPLYKKFISNDIHNWFDTDMPKPAIHMYCQECDSSQTFNMINEYYEVDGLCDGVVIGHTVRARYLCTSCKKYIRIFFIEFGEFETQDGEKKVTKRYMRKVGQNPPWSIEIEPELEKLLSDHSEYYKKGLICESQGYGIGAFAYFRRIVEEIIDQLLDSIEGLLEGEDRKKYKAVLAEVKKTIVAQEKIELVKDLLPSSLRPDGINPLAAIHSALSNGIHVESDEECLEWADAIREALVFLVNRIVRTKKENKSFAESMKKLLNKKSNKNAKS